MPWSIAARQTPAHRVRVQAAAVEIGSLDEQVGVRARRPQLGELRPEVVLANRAVEVEHTLALDDRVRADGVVAGGKSGKLDLGPELLEQSGDAATCLLHVDDDPYGCASHVPRTLARFRPRGGGRVRPRAAGRARRRAK
jgi:hypothetical protein